MNLALSSSHQTHAEISRLAEDTLADKFRAIDGVANVKVNGSLQRELSVGTATQVAGRALFASIALLAFVAVGERRGVVRVFASMGRAELAVAICTAVASSAFIVALLQAEELGMAVGEVLRVQAAQVRLVRRQTARETAAKTPVKILFPVIFTIFPAMFVITIGPGAIQIYRTIFHI